MKADIIDIDLAGADIKTKEGREEVMASVREKLKDVPEKRRKSLLGSLENMFNAMDGLPDVAAELEAIMANIQLMEDLVGKKQQRLRVMSNNADDAGASYMFGALDSFLTIAGGSLMSAGNLLANLAEVAIRDAAKEAGPSGREAPTEPPPAPDPVPSEHVAEAPLG